MDQVTRPIKVVINTRDRGYRLKTWVAYLGVFTLLAGDAVRYSLGWWGWGVLLVALLISTAALFVTNKPLETLKLTPWPLTALLVLMLASAVWSAYPAFTLLATFSQLATSLFGFFLANRFDWRGLLRIFANVVRFVLITSLAFELFAAVVIRGPIAPIFGNFDGEVPPADAYYWTQGNLFDGERIQGIQGNSNLLAYTAMLGLVLFSVELAIVSVNRSLGIASFLLAVGALLLAKSAGIGFALVAITLATAVSLAAEGHDRATRHRYYRIAWGLAAVGAFFVLAFRQTVFDLLGKSPDMTGRTGIWEKVLQLAVQQPLEGWGWISHWVPGVEPYEGLVVIDNVPYYQAHNAYLDMALQLGLTGLALFVGLLTITFISLWQLAVRHTSVLYLWPILIFVGVLVQNLTESRMLIEIGWAILVLFAVKVREPQENLEPRGKTPKRVRLLYRGLQRSRSQRHKGR